MDLLLQPTKPATTTNLQTPLILEEEERFTRKEILEEVKKQLWLAGPLVSVNVLTYMLQVVSVMFVGHLGELQLAGASLATSFASVTSITLLKGMGSALETLCGQSYGAKQYSAIGIHLQRSLIVLLLAAIPLSVASFFAGEILLFLGQDPEISISAGSYAKFVIPSIFGFAILESHVKFLQSQNNVLPVTATTGFTTLLHVLVCWTLVFKSGLGNRGAAIANGVAYWINGISLFVYVRVSRSCKLSWTGWSREALHGIPGFVRLAIPSALMLSLEIWSFESMVLLAGLLPNPKLETSVLSISLNTTAIIYMIPLGLSATASTRVSNELGAGRPRAASRAVCAGLILVVIEGIVVATILISGHNIWGYLYSKEKRIVKYVAEILVLLAFSHLLDGIQYVLSGGCRGCGWQKIGAVVNLGAYYFIGLPCSLVLAFVFHKGGKGLWIGVIVAILAQASSFLILTFFTDWEKQVKIFDFRTFRFAFGLQLS
ncbi:Protein DETOXIFICATION 16 [Linum grandiflorum]